MSIRKQTRPSLERPTAAGPRVCPHRPPCSACPRFAERDIAPAARGRLNDYARSQGLSAVTVLSGSTAGFRTRARLAIRGRLGSPKIGLFELDTHRVVHIPHCSVHHPLINRVANTVRRALVEARVPSYSDAAHLGLARYLQVTVERSSQTAQVVLVANAETPEPLTDVLNLIRERLGNDLHSLWMNSNTGRSNTVMGPVFHHWSGPGSVVERFGGCAVHYPPGAFGQSNLEIAEDIIEHLRAEIPDGAKVTEFYAGVGAIGLSILSRAGRLRMNEISPQSLIGLELGVAALDAESRAKVEVLPGPAGTVGFAASDSQVVIANPPRKGLARELTAQFSVDPPERFLYVSCGLESFLEDAAELTGQGKCRLITLSAFNLLPFTDHVETLARFDRS